jgi:transposase-like protein
MEKPRKGSKGGRLTIYEDSFKILVAREYLTGEFSMLQVAKKHGLSESTMYHFMRWYKKQELVVKEEPQSSSLTAPSLKHSIALAKELAYAKLKITALELLISNAEREMGVDIVKKPGTKPSGK